MGVDLRVRSREDRDAELDRVRRAARYRRTASLLEGWARGSANRAVAGLVLERAAERRAAADRAAAGPSRAYRPAHGGLRASGV